MNETRLQEVLKQAQTAEPTAEELKTIEYILDHAPAGDFGEGVCLGYMLGKLIIKQS